MIVSSEGGEIGVGRDVVRCRMASSAMTDGRFLLTDELGDDVGDSERSSSLLSLADDRRRDRDIERKR